MKNSVAIATMAILIASSVANAEAQPSSMKITQPSPAGQTLTKDKLDRVKRYIIEAGERCTYVNMYNNNPCIETSEFRLYLNPDPGPNGHPQWNINCDTTRGDFNTLVVQEKSDASAYHTIDFRDANAIAFRGEEKGSELILKRAVLDVLRRIDSEISGQRKPGK